MWEMGAPPTTIRSGSIKTSEPPAAGRLSSAMRPKTVAVCPATADALVAALGSVAGSSARPTPRSAATSARASTAGRTAIARATQGIASAMAAAPRSRSTMRAQSPARGNAPGCAGRSQREVAPGHHIVGLAHAEDVDELAGVLKSAEVGAVVDDVLGERAREAWNDLELFGGGEVEVDSGDDCPACGALRVWNFYLLAVFQAAGEVGEAGDVRVHG